ncbi:hypothetical protein MRB53_039080 [Persea americana]|nr:hypothetical protein MRB53_039080 [Persea americana]
MDDRRQHSDDNDTPTRRLFSPPRPSSRLARPPSYISDVDGTAQLPTTPRRTYTRENSRARDQSPAPTYLTYPHSRQTSPERTSSRQDIRIGRPVSRRLSDVETPVLTPTAVRPSSASPSRLIGARALPVAPVNRSTSPDTAIRMPLMPEKSGWVDEANYETGLSKSPSIKAYSVSTYDEDDARSIAPSLTETLGSIDIENSHYGPAPTQPQARRNAAQKTTEVVKLTDGNLVLDCAIPDKLRSLLSRHDSREFTHVKYTACTCDPDEFAREGFTLRQVGLGRHTELLITLTMYNENELLFTRTLHGVVKNIAHLCSRTKSRTWGPQGWKKVVVCIVADGRRNVNPRVLDVLAAIGVYQEGLAQNKVDGKPVTAHIYEYTSQYSITSDLQFRGSEKGIPPIQLLFCLKEQNAKKLNSHRWMFNGFAPLLVPNVCVLLDVGTRPGSDSIYHLWKTFDLNSNVAGAAGEIKILKGKAWSALMNPLVASQNFEYKMSNILDKPFQSVLGYIAVLPGAFSAYRYVALAPDEFGRGPLDSYFKGERDRKWLLKYVSEAWGETDCPDTVAELIGQRRRWLNGATFAATFALYHFKQIWYTSHSKTRKFFLHVEFAYQAFELLLTFFGLANFYLTFFFITQSFGLEYHWASYVFVILRYLCIMVTAGQFILAVSNRVIFADISLEIVPRAQERCF